MNTTTAVQPDWRADARLVAFVRDRFERRLANYKNIPDEVRDHHETEIEALAGGYSYRQVLELVQNAADAILEQSSSPQTAAGLGAPRAHTPVGVWTPRGRERPGTGLSRPVQRAPGGSSRPRSPGSPS
jgi:hypothetical protein